MRTQELNKSQKNFPHLQKQSKINNLKKMTKTTISYALSARNPNAQSFVEESAIVHSIKNALKPITTNLETYL